MNVFDKTLITVLAPQFAVFTFRQFGVEVHGLAVAASDRDAIEPPKERHGLMPPWNVVYGDFGLGMCCGRERFQLARVARFVNGQAVDAKIAATLALAQQCFTHFV